MAQFDYDFVVIGSGFGGSVSALRLTEKGYSVAVIEQGRRFTTDTLPKSAWNLRRYLWAPRLGMRGIFAITTLKDVVIFHGAGVGGGSLVYANTHLEPLDTFFTDPLWAHLADWKRELAPYYTQARRMLGTKESPAIFAADETLRDVLTDMGTGKTFKKHDVGVFFGEPGVKVPDPYFGGRGPDRVGCNFCGACMVGCTVGAKNTLDRNYLYLAEQNGAKVIADTRVVDVRPLGAADGSDGYELHTRTTAGLLGRTARITAKQVVFSGGVLGTLDLLLRARTRGSLPRLSDALGTYVRTNSESIQGVSRGKKNLSHGIAISSGGFTPDGTHIEMVRYGETADAMSALATVHVPGGKLPRQVYFIGALLKQPLMALRQIAWPFGWSKSTAIVLAMQAIDNSMRLKLHRRWWWPFNTVLTSDWGNRKPPPRFLPEAHEVTRRIAEKLGAEPGSVLPEVVLDTTTTAHILGGCPMGDSARTGVIDTQNRVFGYQGMYVVDASMIGANLGVNPTLTITAMAERAMAFVEAKQAADPEQPHAQAAE